jgi:hypothetical protein
LNITKKILYPVFLIFLLLEGCVPSKPTEETEILSSERLINKLEANRRKIKNFEGIGTFEIKSEQFNDGASFQVIMIKPDSIYFAVLGPFGIELAQSMITNNSFIFYDVLHNTAYRGKVTDDVLRKIFKINLSFSDLLDAFVGSVNLTPNLYKQPTSFSIEGDNYILTYTDEEKHLTWIYRVDIRQLGITSFTLTSDNNEINIEGNYSNFEFIENVAVPYNIEIINKIKNQKLKINYKDITANEKGLSVNFELPGDAEIVEW